MKKLMKTLLINWLYYDKLVLEFSDINYLVGKNASGKSTFLDALMIVLLGEVSSRNFNKAANEKAQRSLKRYLRADMDPNNPKTRKGRSFNSYIACEFYDDVQGKDFTIGIIFDCFEDGSERYNFFTYDDKIPENCFIIDRKPMDISELRRFLREQYKSRQEIYDNNKKYRSAIKAKWNIHVDQVFSVLKQGAFFKPIEDIREFITEHICDIQERPDIVSMQQNIQDYKHQEKLAERQEAKIEQLQRITDLYRRYNRAFELLNIHEFLKSKAESEIEKASVTKYETEIGNCKLELEDIVSQRERLREEMEELKALRDRLIASEPYKEYEHLQNEKTRLAAEYESLSDILEKTTAAIRTEVFVWHKYCLEFEATTWVDEVNVKKIREDMPNLKSALAGLEQLRSDDFRSIDTSLFTQLHEALKRHTELLSDCCYGLENVIRQYKTQSDDLRASLRGLEKGKKDYPSQFLQFHEALAARLLSDNGLDIPLYPLSDLLEITDLKWQRAIEGYLNTQRFQLVVDPKHYPLVLMAYNKIKRDFPGYGIVDVERVRQRGKIQRLPQSLATKVEPTSDLVKEYIDFLLGRVICCQRVEDLRSHSTAITAEGMLYQGYVARAIPHHILASVYIGKSALEQQIQAKKEQLQELTTQNEAVNNAFGTLKEQKEKEIRMTKYYIEDTLLQMPENHKRRSDISSDLGRLAQKLDEISRGGFLTIIEQKKDAEDKIQANLADYDSFGKKVGARENRIKNLENEILPDHRQKLKSAENHIANRFSETFVKTTGEPKYQEELARLKIPDNIKVNFGNQLEQTKRRCDESWKNLVYARRDYVNNFPPCSYHPDSQVNDDFDRELEQLLQVELPKFKEKIKAAHESAIEQFQNDFIAKLTSNIKAVEDQVRELNKALKQTRFGTDQYHFVVEKNPDEAEYYNMITDPDWMESSEGLFSFALQSRYGVLIEELFRKIVASDDTALNARKQSELLENIEKYTDYRTYLRFDLKTTDQNGNVEHLSQTLKSKSGGETQTPFYIAILASFVQVYKAGDKSSFGNTMRLVVFDEAFSKMDSERIIECIRLLRKMGLQAIFSTPPDKIPDIMPISDTTYLAYHDKEKYKMYIELWSKEMEGIVLEQ